jgi:hypothetical protein
METRACTGKRRDVMAFWRRKARWSILRIKI